MALLTEYADLDEQAGGLFRQTIYLKPIAYWRAGSLVRLVNRLGCTNDPVFPVGVDERVQFRLRERLDAQLPFCFIAAGQSWVRITALGVQPVVGRAVGENGFRYDGAWPGADLAMTYGGHTIGKAIHLSADHPSSFSFRVEGAELDLTTLRMPDLVFPPPYLEHPVSLERVPLSWEVGWREGAAELTVRLPPGDWAGWVVDPTTTLQPASAGFDTFLDSLNNTTNFGTNTALQAGDNSATGTQNIRSLIKFDLSSLPNNIVVTEATLSLFEFAANGTGSWDIHLQRLLRDWVESQATWNIYSTGNNWTTAGAGSDGSDRSATITATITGDGISANGFVDITSATLADDVERMRNGTYPNYGWIIHAPNAESTPSEVKRTVWKSSDHGDSSDRPKLEVTYTLSGPGPILGGRVVQ